MKKKNAWQTAMYDERFARATIASREYAGIARAESEFLIEAMGLVRGEEILDVPCGTGRHARVFASHGLRVTGVDLSPKLIRMAKRAGKKPGLSFETGDMAKLSKHRGKFDAVVNLFTSFGYFSTEVENQSVLRGMVNALRPGGRLGVHLIDRDWLLGRFRANTWKETAGGIFTLEARNYDPKTKRIEAQTVILDRKTGRAQNYYHSTRLYSKPELVRMMKAAGLKRVEVFGGADGSLYRKGDSSHPVYIGWKSR